MLSKKLNHTFSDYWRHITPPTCTSTVVGSYFSMLPTTFLQTFQENRHCSGSREGCPFHWCINIVLTSCLSNHIPDTICHFFTILIPVQPKPQFIIWLELIWYGEPCLGFVFISAHIDVVGIWLIMTSPLQLCWLQRNTFPWCVWCIFHLISFHLNPTGLNFCCPGRSQHLLCCNLAPTSNIDSTRYC